MRRGWLGCEVGGAYCTQVLYEFVVLKRGADGRPALCFVVMAASRWQGGGGWCAGHLRLEIRGSDLQSLR